MYTRCPSCRSEISFDAPSNLANLPDGFKHRIKCPNCGVTIGVKIPRQEGYLETQPTYRPQNPNAMSFEPTYQAGAPAYDFGAGIDDTAENTGKKVKKPRRSGRPRSASMMVFSLIFAVLGIIGYLITENIIPVGDKLWLGGFQMFDGITMWKMMCTEFELFKALIGADALLGFLSLVPMLLFALSSIHFIVSLGCLIAGKYSKLYNFTFGTIISLLAITMLFLTLFITSAGTDAELTLDTLKAHFTRVNDRQEYILYVAAGIGLIMFIYNFFFTVIPMKAKIKKDKNNDLAFEG